MPSFSRSVTTVPNRFAFVPVLLLLGTALITGAFTAGARTTAAKNDSPFAAHLETGTVSSGAAGSPVESPAHGLRLLSQSLHHSCRQSQDHKVVLEEETARCLYRLAVQAEQAEKAERASELP